MTYTAADPLVAHRDPGRSHRTLIKGAGGLLVAGPVAPIAGASLASHVGSLFRVRPAHAGTVDVTPTDMVVPEPHAVGSSHAGEQFTLIFRGPLDRPQPQETYEFRHRNLGNFALVIVPAPAASNSRGYAAVINLQPVEVRAG